jgi:hypothetical protein
MALPTVVVVSAVMIWLLGALSAQLRCVDAARSGARAAANGSSPAVIREAVEQLVPRGARIDIRRRGNEVQVIVALRVTPAALTAEMSVSAEAVAEVEPP